MPDKGRIYFLWSRRCFLLEKGFVRNDKTRAYEKRIGKNRKVSWSLEQLYDSINECDFETFCKKVHEEVERERQC